jgi:hypothetical protein
MGFGFLVFCNALATCSARLCCANEVGNRMYRDQTLAELLRWAALNDTPRNQAEPATRLRYDRG